MIAESPTGTVENPITFMDLILSLGSMEEQIKPVITAPLAPWVVNPSRRKKGRCARTNGLHNESGPIRVSPRSASGLAHSTALT